MPSLHFIAWNSNHGTLSKCLSELAKEVPAIVFLQECAPPESLPLAGQFFSRRVNAHKGIALGSLDKDYRLTQLEPRPNSGRAVLAASVTGPVSFAAIGIWGQRPNYADDVMRTLDAYDDVLRSGPSVVMGDLNSGTNLNKARSPSKGHSRILCRLDDLGLVSAYHSFHHVEHGHETHPTYRHLFKPTRPWHIDFCFVPASWGASLEGVNTIDGTEWAKRSDHLPLKVDLQFTSPEPGLISRCRDERR